MSDGDKTTLFFRFGHGTLKRGRRATDYQTLEFSNHVHRDRVIGWKPNLLRVGEGLRLVSLMIDGEEQIVGTGIPAVASPVPLIVGLLQPGAKLEATVHADNSTRWPVVSVEGPALLASEVTDGAD